MEALLAGPWSEPYGELTEVNCGEVERQLLPLSAPVGIDQARSSSKVVARCEQKVPVWGMTKLASSGAGRTAVYK